MTLFRRNNDVIIALCVRWDRTTLPLRPRLHYIKHTVRHSMQIAPSRAYFRSGPKLKHIDRCGCHLYYEMFCNGYSAPKSINQCLYITMEIGPYSCFWYIKFPWGRGYFHNIYITMEIGPCQWEVNIVFYRIRGYFHSNIYRKLSKRVLMCN